MSTVSSIVAKEFPDNVRASRPSAPSVGSYEIVQLIDSASGTIAKTSAEASFGLVANGRSLKPSVPAPDGDSAT